MVEMRKPDGEFDGEFVEKQWAIDPNSLPVDKNGFRTNPENGKRFLRYKKGFGHIGGDYIDEPPAEIEIPSDLK